MPITPGQTYRSADPRELIRIRIKSYTPGENRALVVDAATGKRPRPMLVTALHESPTTQAGKPRRSGYVLEEAARTASGRPAGPLTHTAAADAAAWAIAHEKAATDGAARTASGQQPETCSVCGCPFPVGHICRGPAVGQPAEAQATDEAEQLVPVGWWCWRGDNHGHLADIPCRSDNVPIHVPSEWADEMRAVVQHLTDDHDPGEDCTWVTPEEQAAETQAAADTVEDER